MAKEKSVTGTVTITAGGKISTALDKSYYRYIAILLPSNWVTSEITFTGCLTSDGTFLEIVNANDVGAVTIPSVAASKCIVLNGEIMEAMLAIPFIKVVATTTQATTDKIITFALKR